MSENCDLFPPGFRFYPTEEELVCFYLRNKIQGQRQEIHNVIPLLNIYDYNPWDLPQMAGEWSRRDGAEQWFFFIPRQEREARGGRPTRQTAEGFWKATGSPGFVYSALGNRVVGGKRTMVFYRGRAPNGRKTEWKMNEYHAIVMEQGGGDQGDNNNTTTSNFKFHQEFSVCRVTKKTKCVRAFDRRPTGPPPPISAASSGPPPPISAASSQLPRPPQTANDIASASQQNHPATTSATAGGSSREGSSNSSGGGDPDYCFDLPREFPCDDYNFDELWCFIENQI